MKRKVAHILDGITMRAMSCCSHGIRAYISVSVCVLLLVYICIPVSAATETPDGMECSGQTLDRDSVKIYFKGGESFYNPDLRDNRTVLSNFIEHIRTLNSEGRINGIIVEGYVSPDGTAAINKRLAEQRSHVLADIIEQQAGIDRMKIKTVSGGINWAELRRMIESRPDVPSRKALLDIIDNTPVWIYDKHGKIVGGRKKSLMDLRGGRPYRWLYANLFPEMRNAIGISLSCSQVPQPIVDYEVTDSITVVEEIPMEEECQTEPDVVVPMDDTEDTRIVQTEPLHILALKTNLLYDAALLPNLELEWYINDKWSVGIEGDLAWWGKYSKNRSYRLGIVSPEVRYRFLRGPLRRGLFVGATFGYGWYDFLKDSPGYLGEGVMSGLICGYQWPISRNLSLEALLGVGYIYTKVKEYRPYEGHHVYMRTKEINYFGPIKLKFSIAWRFLDTNKSKQTIGR